MDNTKTGLFIKEQRMSNNLTQKELAEKINCTDKAVSRWETGKGMPDVSMLLPLSNVLNISVNEILLGEKIEQEKQIEKSNETIVETITESNKKVNNAHIFIFILFVVIEALIFYFPSINSASGDEMAIIFGAMLGVIICSFMLGVTGIKLKYKLLYSPISAIMYIPSTIICFGIKSISDFLALYVPFILAASAILILSGTGITALITKILTKRT